MSNEPEWCEVTPARLTEYRAVKADAAQARTSQQAILAWSIGGIGASAGLLLSGGHLAHGLMVAAFGFWLPSLIAGAAFAWIGELVRMERSSSYARALERSTWPAAQRDGKVHTGLIEDSEYQLVYENVLRFATPHSLYGSPMKVGYVGGALIYFASYLGSMAVASYYSVRYHLGSLGVPIADGVFAAAFLLYVGFLALRLERLSRSALRPIANTCRDAPAAT